MQTDIKFLLVFLIIALAILIYYQNSGNNNIKKNNTQNLIRNNLNNRENFIADDTSSVQQQRVNAREQQRPVSHEQQRPVSHEHKQHILDKLINDINETNSMRVDENRMTRDDDRSSASLDEVDYPKRSGSINQAPPNTYKHHSYKAGNDRQKGKFDELDAYLADADVFKNTDENNSSHFSGYDDNDSNLSDNASGKRENSKYANAHIKEFALRDNSPKDKILNLYDSNNYLPNQNKTNPELTKGFQILENPVSVSNANLIPVLKSIPVSSTLGSKKNSTYDIRAEPPNPKTVVSPFLNSDIMPDVYATNRGCL
jgi:hypothetical protein